MRVSPLLWLLASCEVLTSAPVAHGSDVRVDHRLFNATAERHQREILIPRGMNAAGLHAGSVASPLAESDDHLPLPHNYPPPLDFER